ncbi:MAG: hypothetical protein IJU72_01435, partial [Bacteroidales bacterium]|nr:hypothetical protein [Bacteroidales bacterium]
MQVVKATISRAALTALLALLTLSGWAQQGISYQAALRGPDGQPLANREVRLRLALADGTTVYREDQTATTSPLGLLQVAVGEGAPVQGAYADIDWSRPL